MEKVLHLIERQGNTATVTFTVPLKGISEVKVIVKSGKEWVCEDTLDTLAVDDNGLKVVTGTFTLNKYTGSSLLSVIKQIKETLVAKYAL